MLYQSQIPTPLLCRSDYAVSSCIAISATSASLYDMGKLHRQMLEVLGIQDADDLIKLPEILKPLIPVTENMMILKQEPVKAFKYQDHEGSSSVHMAAAQDPKLIADGRQSPFAQVIQQAMAAHIQNMLRSIS